MNFQKKSLPVRRRTGVPYQGVPGPPPTPRRHSQTPGHGHATGPSPGQLQQGAAAKMGAGYAPAQAIMITRPSYPTPGSGGCEQETNGEKNNEATGIQNTMSSHTARPGPTLYASKPLSSHGLDGDVRLGPSSGNLVGSRDGDTRQQDGGEGWGPAPGLPGLAYKVVPTFLLLIQGCPICSCRAGGGMSSYRYKRQLWVQAGHLL